LARLALARMALAYSSVIASALSSNAPRTARVGAMLRTWLPNSCTPAYRVGLLNVTPVVSGLAIHESARVPVLRRERRLTSPMILVPIVALASRKSCASFSKRERARDTSSAPFTSTSTGRVTACLRASGGLARRWQRRSECRGCTLARGARLNLGIEREG